METTQIIADEIVYSTDSYASDISLEKIRSGQTFLYREGGYPGMVVDVRMKDDISGNALKLALDRALVRYPYFTRKLVEKDGTFYLVQNPLPFILEETADLHSLGSAEVNYHLIDVTYEQKSIYIAYDHGLCDGRGIMPFVKTLVYYYCTYRYNKKFRVQDVRFAGEPLLPGETAEPFGEKLDRTETQIPTIHKDGYVLPDSINSIGKNKNTSYRYEITINHENFMRFAKENNATPAIAVALFIAKAIKNVYPEAEKPIVCNLACDLRKGIDIENTFKNCVGSVSLPYSAEFDKLSFKEQATAYRTMLNEYRDADNLRREVNKQTHLYERLDGLQSYEAKKEMLSFFNNLITNTFVLSYVGQTKLGDCEKYIDSFHMYTSGTIGLSMEMLSVGKYITIDFMQSFQTDKFIHALAQSMEEAGLDFSLSDQIEFSVPKDSIRASDSTRLPASILKVHDRTLARAWETFTDVYRPMASLVSHTIEYRNS